MSASITGILATAKRLAADNGVTEPATVSYVKTTRVAASQIISGGTEAQGNSDIYIVDMQGSFTGYTAKVPAGAQLPKGHHMIVTFDGETGDMTDWSIGDTTPNLHALGNVSALSHLR